MVKLEPFLKKKKEKKNTKRKIVGKKKDRRSAGRKKVEIIQFLHKICRRNYQSSNKRTYGRSPLNAQQNKLKRPPPKHIIVIFQNTRHKKKNKGLSYQFSTLQFLQYKNQKKKGVYPLFAQIIICPPYLIFLDVSGVIRSHYWTPISRN